MRALLKELTDQVRVKSEHYQAWPKKHFRNTTLNNIHWALQLYKHSQCERGAGDVQNLSSDSTWLGVVSGNQPGGRSRRGRDKFKESNLEF